MLISAPALAMTAFTPTPPGRMRHRLCRRARRCRGEPFGDRVADERATGFRCGTDRASYHGKRGEEADEPTHFRPKGRGLDQMI
ncbi:hypothetical protein EMEDMD4_370086 [Sinorhizobium medicae]|uniref:Uncharacterized protein n=1 Tax=Sinorhizobium medicae TaxID=110321 RepID=A0A508X321_9HYPH|nr:hypothetical protein EMEDMD4_370086 [Sinorhizobium medicae]